MKKFLFIILVILSISSISFAKFSDVKMYTTEINYLTSKGIISGYEDNTFRPNNNITRAELAKMIVKATGKTNFVSNEFSDVASNHWARMYIDIAVAQNYIKGDTEGTFRPEDNITYGEVATVLVRAMGESESAEKLYLEWPSNYIKKAEYLKLFDGYKTNDLIAENDARRDSVALMIYNMLNYDKEQNEKKNTKVDTKTAYAGIVDAQITRRGIDYIKVVDEENDEIEIELTSKSVMPKINSFIIYQFNSNEEANIRKELAVDDIDSSYSVVEKVEDELIKLKDKDKLLDLDLDKYTVGSKTYKLNKINFFIIELDTEENKFTDFELQLKGDLKLKKDDRIKFDETLNACYVIREVK